MTAITSVEIPANTRDPDRAALDAMVMRPGQPFGQLVMLERIVQNELERPRRRQAHGDLHDHRDEYDDEPAPVGPKEVEHQLRSLLVRLRVVVRHYESGGRCSKCSGWPRT